MAAEIRSGAAAVAQVIAAFCLLLLTLGAGRAALAATIVGAAIDKDGPVVEMRFAIRGRGLRWRVSTHRQELWIDLSDTRMRIGARPFAGREASPVASVTVIDGGGGAARIVVGVIGRADYAVVRTPRQLTLRVAPAGAVSNLAAPLLAAARSESFAPRRSAQPRLHPPRGAELASAAHPTPSNDRVVQAAPADRRPIVMIDPGHGGRDPGTESASGVEEKDIALQIALRLRSALVARGVDARLTRSADAFIPLDERTRIANAAGADLFVSIHLNSSPDAATTGIETYYLNNTTDRATIRLARMENGIAGGYSAPGGPDLHYILTDLRQQYKANESASLARMIEAATVADAAAETGIRVNELGAKQGPFYVLVGALMPSVLVECGFLSNPSEARLLQSPAYQQAIADGIAQAVAHYFNADAAIGNL
ncbi:N-acetylmuramoyl-L-alanine amidase [bacterium]|nr:N-acetylmuramoyl-L-alanine amidase [bacterium]